MVASEGGEVGLPAGIELLRSGASALDAVEAVVRLVEANEADHYVGVGGLPNLLGVVELDASLMEGTTRRAGAVGAMTGFPHPISVARAVLERLPQHVLLVGAGAERFADEAGIPRGETLTEDAKRLWAEGLEPAGLSAAEARGPGEVRYRRSMLERLRARTPPGPPWGTVNVIGLDPRGRLAVGVSTSGYPWKYPGRLGDTPVIGAGNYCDDRVGAAACTGRGELAIRAGTARSVLFALAAGMAPADACRQAVADTLSLPDDYRSGLQAICLTPDGRHGGASTTAGGRYSVMRESDAAPRTVERVTP
jgi:beta-aspartyl-peptidase (threonine type)